LNAMKKAEGVYNLVVVGAGTGNCTIYVDPGSKERKK